MGAVDGYGLNKAARIKARRREQEKAERAKALPLDASYPGGFAPFDPFFFGLKHLSSEPKEG